MNSYGTASDLYRRGFAEALEHRRYLVSKKKVHRPDHEFFLALDEATHPESPAVQETIKAAGD